jgi:predicted Rossmann-fold nucleotide-binding protein
MLTWNQLGIITKPVGLLNINGFFNPLIRMLNHAVEEQFLRAEHRAILQFEEDEEKLMDKLNNYQPVVAQKWIERLKEGKI